MLVGLRKFNIDFLITCLCYGSATKKRHFQFDFSAHPVEESAVQYHLNLETYGPWHAVLRNVSKKLCHV